MLRGKLNDWYSKENQAKFMSLIFHAGASFEEIQSLKWGQIGQAGVHLPHFYAPYGSREERRFAVLARMNTWHCSLAPSVLDAETVFDCVFALEPPSQKRKYCIPYPLYKIKELVENYDEKCGFSMRKIGKMILTFYQKFGIMEITER